MKRNKNHGITRKDIGQIMNGLKQSDVVIPNTCYYPSPHPSPTRGEGVKLNLSWIIGRSAGSTLLSLGRVPLSLHSCQNPQFGMTINNSYVGRIY